MNGRLKVQTKSIIKDNAFTVKVAVPNGIIDLFPLQRARLCDVKKFSFIPVYKSLIAVGQDLNVHK